MEVIDFLYSAMTKISTALLLTLWCIRVVGSLKKTKEAEDES